MVNRKITKFISGTILLGSASSCGLQAYDDLGSANKNSVFGKDVISKQSTVNNRVGVRYFLYFGGGIFILLATYCILCSIGQYLVKRKCDEIIGKLENQVFDYEKEKEDALKEYNQIVKKVINLLEVRKVYDARIEDVKKEKKMLKSKGSPYLMLKEIIKEAAELHEYHSSLSIPYSIESRENVLKEKTKIIDNTFKEFKQAGISIGIEEFSCKNILISNYDSYCNKFFAKILRKLSENNVNVVYKKGKSCYGAEELDLDRMDFSDLEFKKSISEDIGKYKFLLSKKISFYEGGEVNRTVKEIENLKASIEKNKDEFLKDGAKPEQYKKKAKELLDKVEKFSFDLEGVNEGISELKEKLESIVNSGKDEDMGKDDYSIPTGLLEKINTQLDNFYKGKEVELEVKIQKIEDEKGSVIENGSKLSKSKEKLECIGTNKKNLQDKIEQLYKIKTENWYKLHCLARHYYNVQYGEFSCL